MAELEGKESSKMTSRYRIVQPAHAPAWTATLDPGPDNNWLWRVKEGFGHTEDPVYARGRAETAEAAKREIGKWADAHPEATLKRVGAIAEAAARAAETAARTLLPQDCPEKTAAELSRVVGWAAHRAAYLAA